MNNQAQNKLVSLLTKPNHLMVDVLHAHQIGELVLTDAIIRDTVAQLADNAKAKNTIVFLLNVIKHKTVFDKINTVMLARFKQPQEMTNEEFDKLLLSKTISKFRTALDLKTYLHGDLAVELYATAHEQEIFKAVKTESEKSVMKKETVKKSTK